MNSKLIINSIFCFLPFLAGIGAMGTSSAKASALEGVSIPIFHVLDDDAIETSGRIDAPFLFVQEKTDSLTNESVVNMFQVSEFKRLIKSINENDKHALKSFMDPNEPNANRHISLATELMCNRLTDSMLDSLVFLGDKTAAILKVKPASKPAEYYVICFETLGGKMKWVPALKDSTGTMFLNSIMELKKRNGIDAIYKSRYPISPEAFSSFPVLNFLPADLEGALKPNERIEAFYKASIDARIKNDTELFSSFYSTASRKKIEESIKGRYIEMGEGYGAKLRANPEEILGVLRVSPFNFLFVRQTSASGAKILRYVSIVEDENRNLAIANYFYEDFLDDFLQECIKKINPDPTRL